MVDQRVTIRPNGTYTSGGTIQGGAASRHAAASDDSDATYIKLGDGQGGYKVAFNMTDVSLPSRALIRRVRTRARHRQGDDYLGIREAFKIINPTTGVVETNLSYQFTCQEKNNSWHETYYVDTHWREYRGISASAGNWTEAYINALVGEFELKDFGTFDLSEFYIDIDYNEPPTVSVDAPVGIIGTSTPLVSWSYADVEGDPQTSYEVVVETGDQSANSAPGGGTEVVNSGVVASVNEQHQVSGANALQNGVYTVWVRVYQNSVSSQASYSLWDSSVFTVDVNPPGVPSLTATADNVNKRVELTADSNSVAGQEAEEYEVQYSDDGGTSWLYVRGGNPITVDPVDSAETIYDYESPPNVARQYRARAARIVGSDRLVSAWSATQSATVTNNEWWLKDVFDPSNNMVIEVESDPWNIEHPADIAVFNPLGRRYPVVVRDSTVKAARFTLDIPTIDSATYDGLVALWESGHPMLLVVPGIDKQYYVQFNSPRGEQLRNLNDPYRGNTLQFVEIERPSV